MDTTQPQPNPPGSGSRALGRLVEFDSRSREYPIRSLVSSKPPRSYTWSVDTWLDQGATSSCVGHAWAHELAARPVVERADSALAMSIYFAAQRIDPWPGGAYAGADPKYEGTSVLCGAKICQSLGHFKEYRWAFGLTDLILAIGYAGPAVLGIPWYTGMFDADSEGRIQPTGSVAGGHAILAYRIAVPSPKRSGQIWLHNSWGKGWGYNGDAWLSYGDMDRLLHEQGEACIPVNRLRV